MAVQLAPIPRGPFALIMGIAALVALSVGAMVTLGAPEAENSTLVLPVVLLCLAAAASLCLVPMAGPPLVTPERWGLVVLAVSGARTFLVLGAIVVLIEAFGLPRKPVVYGLLSGTFIIMFTEAAAAAILLNRRDRAMVASRSIESVPTPNAARRSA